MTERERMAKAQEWINSRNPNYPWNGRNAVFEAYLAGYDAREPEITRLRAALYAVSVFAIQCEAAEGVAQYYISQHELDKVRQALTPADDKSTERGGGV